MSLFLTNKSYEFFSSYLGIYVLYYFMNAMFILDKNYYYSPKAIFYLRLKSEFSSAFFMK